MKIILIEGMTEGVGGKETYIINTFRAMDKAKYRFIFVSYNIKIAYEEELIKSGAVIVHVTPRSKNPLVFWKELNQIFKKYNIDVVWAHKTTLSSCEIFKAANKFNVPIIIIHSHCSENMGGRFTQIMHDYNKRRIDKLANIKMACSDVASKWFYDDKESIIMKNAINLEKFRFNSSVREQIRNELKLENKLVLGHVGRFGVEKNHTKLLNVFHKLCEQNPESRLILCGDGEEREHIEDLIQQFNLSDNVILTGIINNVNEMLQAFDVLIMPSLFEGLPFALLEAQASGLKCVVSDTVSSESNVMGWNIPVPLNASDQEWVDSINSIDLHYNREEAYEEMKIKGFDLNDSIKLIENTIDKR